MYYFLSLGSNLGDCQLNLTTATQLIEKNIGAVVASSSLYESSPWGFQSDNRFLNSVLAVLSELSPQELLHMTQSIEKQLGRAEKTPIINGKPIYSDRLIDIDILLAFPENIFFTTLQQAVNSHQRTAISEQLSAISEQSTALSSQQSLSSNHYSAISYLINNSLRISTPTLTLPHPHILQREFVTAPLIELISCLTQK